MRPVIDLDKEYGIVLEGGGAKGAYQIGAWRALKEAGVRIKGIAGTSVGALNGALMCMDDYENAKDVWETISYSKIMDVDDDQMSQLFHGKVSFKEFWNLAAPALKEGGMDITPLRQLIASHVDADKILNSPKEFYILTFCVDELEELDVNVKELSPEMIPDLLLASAYIFPIFKNEKMYGKMFVDGGIINNVPLDSLVRRDYKDIIMIRIFGIGRQRKVKIPEDAHVYSIEPKVDLGNIIDFDPEKSRMHIRLGYYDAMRFIYGLSGSIYYIDEDKTQLEYLERLCRSCKEDALRKFVETGLVSIARELKLPLGWSYKELYLGALEATAKLCKVPKYHIYTVEELEQEIHTREEKLDLDKLPAFAKLIKERLEEN